MRVDQMHPAAPAPVEERRIRQFIEPLLVDDAALRQCPNTLLTPHIAAITATSLRNMSVGAAEDMLRILRGETPRNLVNPHYQKQR